MPLLSPSRAPGAVGAPDDSLVVSALWRAIRVLRPLAMVYAVWAAWTRRDEMQQPTTAFGILGVLALWTLVALVWERRELGWHVVELGLGDEELQPERRAHRRTAASTLPER